MKCASHCVTSCEVEDLIGDLAQQLVEFISTAAVLLTMVPYCVAECETLVSLHVIQHNNSSICTWTLITIFIKFTFSFSIPYLPCLFGLQHEDKVNLQMRSTLTVF
jgi:hypothetical protein